MVLVVKNLLANAVDKRQGCNPWVEETPLEEGMGTHSSIFTWRILWTEEPGGLQSIRSQRVRYN